MFALLSMQSNVCHVDSTVDSLLLVIDKARFKFKGTRLGVLF